MKSETECEFSHAVDPNRMPECGLFLRGLCVDPNCRYLHVKKQAGAPDCEDFLTGWCSFGAECSKRHYIQPSSSDKKREREDAESVPEESEEEVLRRIWDGDVVLQIYD